jgi:DNA polymerase elongation subunit (family B)
LTKLRKSIEELSARNMELKLEGQLAKGELESLVKNVAVLSEDGRLKTAEIDLLRKKVKAADEQASKLTSTQKALS